MVVVGAGAVVAGIDESDDESSPPHEVARRVETRARTVKREFLNMANLSRRQRSS